MAALKEFTRYGITAIFSYGLIFLGTYVLTDIIGLRADLSYFIVITIMYIVMYFVSADIIFVSERNKETATRFIIHSFVFWSLNNIFYTVLFAKTDINYLALVVINIAVFALIRFASLRYFVFSKHKDKLEVKV